LMHSREISGLSFTMVSPDIFAEANAA
jgi:hypothetical protein